MIVKVFTQRDCQPCRLTKRKLAKVGLPYEEIPLDASNLKYVQDLGYQTAPVVEVDCGDGATVHWSGFRPGMIDALV